MFVFLDCLLCTLPCVGCVFILFYFILFGFILVSLIHLFLLCVFICDWRGFYFVFIVYKILFVHMCVCVDVYNVL